MEDLRAAAPSASISLLPHEGPFARARRMNPTLPRVNLLLIGPDSAIDNVLGTVTADARQPVVSWQPGKPFVLPNPHPGTVIVRGVDTLVQDDQRRLLEWLERAAGVTQVISTSSAPLLPSVEAGAFMQTLYYRLNTIYLDLTKRHGDPLDW